MAVEAEWIIRQAAQVSVWEQVSDGQREWIARANWSCVQVHGYGTTKEEALSDLHCEFIMRGYTVIEKRELKEEK